MLAKVDLRVDWAPTSSTWPQETARTSQLSHTYEGLPSPTQHAIISSQHSMETMQPYQNPDLKTWRASDDVCVLRGLFGRFYDFVVVEKAEYSAIHVVLVYSDVTNRNSTRQCALTNVYSRMPTPTA